MWIYEQQANDGCFYSKNKKLNVWPLNFVDQYELTGYVLASLLEAGLISDLDIITRFHEFNSFL